MSWLWVAAFFAFAASEASAVVALCDRDADCDDLLACNGSEICFSGFCLVSDSPCRELACTEDGTFVYCAGRPLLATAHASMSWSEDGTLDPAVRFGLGVFSPSTGRLFDERTYSASDVGDRFSATSATDADFAGLAQRLSDGANDPVGICRATTSGGLPSSDTCNPSDENLFFGQANESQVDRIDFVLTSLSVTPGMGATDVAMTADVQLLPEAEAGRLALALVFGLCFARQPGMVSPRKRSSRDSRARTRCALPAATSTSAGRGLPL